jgi:hypothetical protein
MNCVAHRAAIRKHPAAVRVLLPVLWSAIAAVVTAQETTTSNVMAAHGVLSRNGKAGNLWVLKVPDALRFRDETILEVTFLTSVGEASNVYAPYDGKYVELVGEVKSVFHGNAVMRTIHTVGIVEAPALNSGQFGAPTPARPVDDAEARRVPYTHAYYLFLADPPAGCELCYVPLLITQHSLDDVDKSKATVCGVWIVTYERDSIWELKGAAPIDPSLLDVARRVIRIGSRSYRYQEVAPGEVLKLLEHPLGTIPISRPGLLPKSVPGASMNELIADFRALRPAGSTTGSDATNAPPAPAPNERHDTSRW